MYVEHNFPVKEFFGRKASESGTCFRQGAWDVKQLNLTVPKVMLKTAQWELRSRVKLGRSPFTPPYSIEGQPLNMEPVATFFVLDCETRPVWVLNLTNPAFQPCVVWNHLEKLQNVPCFANSMSASNTHTIFLPITACLQRKQGSYEPV